MAIGTKVGAMKEKTKIVHAGRDPKSNHGAVNPPVYHASTILYPTYEDLKHPKTRVQYGRRGTPTVFALEDAIMALEGGAGCAIVPSGLNACTTALLAFLSAGDHLLMPDSAYGPTRNFCNTFLKRMGVETTFYDPTIGADIAALMTDQTKVVFVESPGSLTFEVQDIPAIADVAHANGAKVILDNTWASPLFFKPYEHGVDVSIQAATKYVVGHADTMLGTITANEECWPLVHAAHGQLGLCAGPDDIFLALRGLRTLDVRLKQHMKQGIELATWLGERDEVSHVLHPALPSHPQHDIWARDFLGASGLFSVVLNPVEEDALAAMLDGLELFGMGYSWGGFESLVVPSNPARYRTATTWDVPGRLLRFHAGLEDMDDLKADLDKGLARLKAAG
ncbi:Cystathionine beta-lyase [Candidatus Phaeomarinobacter ectocarpi]|uniref:Cystathionine beta-lyase n=1 Tax=Candidatus Phaeomarinibacter ectocarpi TaxID=1458461 RepID=X5MPB9_9HYPH|nr:cystathionine beta-lyase [Candidatus Phaeomarinobacter ectocarpi]CDO61266.1 Cystathionine beta-lyase [Candidatus Phaeomarinobacter ectocarpi]